MRIKTFILLIGLFPFLLFSQVGFKAGYIINTNHQRIECLIANYGVDNSSMKYVYKLFKKDSLKKINIKNVEGFGIDNSRKFTRAKVMLEISDDRITQLSDTIRGLRWIEKYVFLQVLIEGKFASLYSYFEEGNSHFYYSSLNTSIEPLIYKKYYLAVAPHYPTSMIINNTYKKQLKKNLICADGDISIKNLSYNKKKLIEYFKAYYKCNWTDYQAYDKINKSKFKLKIAFIINQSSFRINDGQIDFYQFPAKINYSMGLEAEYLIPFNRYKWSLFAEANYQYYKSNFSEPNLNSECTINYQFIEIPLGLNYYIILNENHRLFIRTAIVPNFIVGDSYMSFYNPENRYELTSSLNVFVGGGYCYRRLGIEFRYYSVRNITQNLYLRGSEFSQISLRLKYSFAQSKQK